MGLDAAGYDRIYVLAKGRIENTGGRTPLSAESIFLIYHRQLFFDIVPYGEYRHVWLTAHVLNVVVYHRLKIYENAFQFIHIEIMLMSFPTRLFQDKKKWHQNEILNEYKFFSIQNPYKYISLLTFVLIHFKLQISILFVCVPNVRLLHIIFCILWVYMFYIVVMLILLIM